MMAALSIRSLQMSGITSGEDIYSLLKRCRKCRMFTNNGKFIIAHHQLPQLLTNAKTLKNFGCIVNTASEDTIDIAHWFAILKFGTRLIVCDSLNNISKYPDVKTNVLTFCNNNNLNYEDLKFCCQEGSSLSCGYISLFFIAKGSVSSAHSFLSTIHVLRQYSIKTREKWVLSFVRKHFKL